MASPSSFLSRFSLSRNASPVLPLHSKPLRHKPSEYDLDQLSPEPEPSSLLLSADAEPAFLAEPAFRSNASPDSMAGPSSAAPSRMRPPALFAGPPPPIATSMLLFRDADEGPVSGSILEHGGRRWRQRGDNAGGLSPSPLSLSPARQRRPVIKVTPASSLDSDSSTWTVLQRRERALQKEIQMYLDIQSAGLSAGLSRGGGGPLSPGSISDGRSNNTPTAESVAYTTTSGRSPARLPTVDRATASGAIIPVRQPRARKLGLRAARAGLGRSIALLAELKAEEDASLAAALQARRRVLAHLRRLSGRRGDIARELQALESDGEEPLARELATLRRAHASTGQQITELEGQLAMLRQRKRTLEGRIQDVQNQRDAGLSGYRGALKEVDAQLTAVLRRPPIQPLDMDALGVRTGHDRGSSSAADAEGSIRLEDKEGWGEDDVEDVADADAASTGAIFLRMLPERRTADMARYWWESEARLLERRRREVSTERAALEEGGAVWQNAVQLVSDFEADLRKEMKAGRDGSGTPKPEVDLLDKGKAKAPTPPAPEDLMRAQLERMAAVIAGLRALLQTAQERGWNLLICAIGAELEAFCEARALLRLGLRDAGIEVEDSAEEEDVETASKRNSRGNLLDVDGAGLDDLEDTSPTPRLGHSASEAPGKTSSPSRNLGFPHGPSKDDARADRAASESDDNDVPPELLVTHEPEVEEHENNVPPEFLSEQHADEADKGPP